MDRSEFTTYRNRLPLLSLGRIGSIQLYKMSGRDLSIMRYVSRRVARSASRELRGRLGEGRADSLDLDAS